MERVSRVLGWCPLPSEASPPHSRAVPAIIRQHDASAVGIRRFGEFVWNHSIYGYQFGGWIFLAYHYREFPRMCCLGHAGWFWRSRTSGGVHKSSPSERRGTYMGHASYRIARMDQFQFKPHSIRSGIHFLHCECAVYVCDIHCYCAGSRNRTNVHNDGRV